MTSFVHHPEYALFAVDAKPHTASVYLENGEPVGEIDNDNHSDREFVRGKSLVETFDEAYRIISAKVKQDGGELPAEWSVQTPSGDVLTKGTEGVEAHLLAALSAPRVARYAMR